MGDGDKEADPLNHQRSFGLLEALVKELGWVDVILSGCEQQISASSQRKKYLQLIDRFMISTLMRNLQRIGFAFFPQMLGLWLFLKRLLPLDNWKISVSVRWKIEGNT